MKGFAMGSIFLVGVIMLCGFVLGEVAKALKLPKVTGYILAGILLNPQISHFIPEDFTQNTDLVTNLALAFITFSIGGTLRYSKIKKMCKAVLSVTFFEPEFAFLAVAAGFILLGRFFIHISGEQLTNVFIPLGILIAALAAPTDTSATLAVIHEYKAKGEVTSTIKGVLHLMIYWAY